MIDTTTVNQVSGIVNQVVNVFNLAVLVVGAIASFIAGHSHGKKSVSGK